MDPSAIILVASNIAAVLVKRFGAYACLLADHYVLIYYTADDAAHTKVIRWGVHKVNGVWSGK